MAIIITGSEGFIGFHLKEKLKERGEEIIPWDIKLGTDIAHLFVPPDVTFVVHLAAIADVRRSIREPDPYWENNVLGTKHVQDTCAKAKIGNAGADETVGVPLLYASSSCVHAWGKSPYGMSKKVNELTAHEGQVAMRFTTVYGDGARDTMFMGKLQYGELEYVTEHVRDFIHVNDIVNGIISLMDNFKHLNHPAYNMGTSHGNVVKDLAKLGGFEGEVREGDACEALDNTADITNMLEDTDWKPTINVQQYIKNGFTL